MSLSPIQNVVSEYRKTRKMSLRQFAIQIGVSYQAIKDWEDGVYAPSFGLLLVLKHNHHNSIWVRDFAADCMAVLMPDAFNPTGEIGKKVLSEEVLDG